MKREKKELEGLLRSLGYSYGFIEAAAISDTRCHDCKRLLRNEPIGIDYETEHLWEYYCLGCIGIIEGGPDENKKTFSVDARPRTRAARKTLPTVPRWGDR